MEAQDAQPSSTTLLLGGRTVEDKALYVSSSLRDDVDAPDASGSPSPPSRRIKVKKDDEISLSVQAGDDSAQARRAQLVLVPPTTRWGRRCTRCACVVSVVGMAMALVAFSAITYGLRVKDPQPSFISIAGPSAPHVDARNYTSLALSWTTPTFDPSLIANYSLEAAVAGDVDTDGFAVAYEGATARANVQGLAANTTYIFRVRFYTVNQQVSNYSDVAIGRTLIPTAPAAPAALYLTATSTSSLALAWDVPAAHGAAITAYTVNATNIANGGVVSAFSDEPSAILKSLDLDTAYAVSVSAQNSEGASEWSDPQNFHTDAANIAPPDAPDAPEEVQADAQSITLRWALNADNGAEVLASTLQMSSESGPALARSLGDDAMWTTVYEGPALQHTVLDLLPSTSYSFRVSAANNAGSSEYVEATAATAAPGVPSPPPPPVASNATQESLSIQWVAGLANGSPIDQFELQVNVSADSLWTKRRHALEVGGMPVLVAAEVAGQRHAQHQYHVRVSREAYDDDSFTTVYSGKETQYTVTQLSAGLVVGARVRAHNAVGWGMYSRVSALSTLGVCNDPEDLTGLGGDPDEFNDQFNKCGTKCLGGASCVANCIADAEGLTEQCASCYGDFTKCTKQKCFSPCVAGSSDKCDKCCAQNCLQPLTSCMGIPCSLQPILNDYCSEYAP